MKIHDFLLSLSWKEWEITKLANKYGNIHSFV